MDVTREPFDLELEGRPAGRGCIRLSDDGWCYGWERADGTVHAAGPFESEQAAGEALMNAVVGWYGMMQ